MDLAFFPGCTLKTSARELEVSTLAAMERLGVHLVELPRWNCCGTVYSMTDDDLAHQIAPVRDLARAAEQGSERLVTVCSFCYNTLKQADILMRTSPEKRDAINAFMDDEVDYTGQVEVIHLLSLLRDDIGWGEVAARVERPLAGLKVVAYYGCTLTRPQAAAIDTVEAPTVMEDCLRALGADVPGFPLATECCGAYEVVGSPGAVEQRRQRIITAAQRLGAGVIALSCPLCASNLQQPDLPVVYFTQLLALALGATPEECGLSPDEAGALQGGGPVGG